MLDGLESFVRSHRVDVAYFLGGLAVLIMLAMDLLRSYDDAAA